MGLTETLEVGLHPRNASTTTSRCNGSDSMTYTLITEKQFENINVVLAVATILISLLGVSTNAVNIRTFITMGLTNGISVNFLTLAISDFGFTLLTVISRTAFLLSSLEGIYNTMWFFLDPYAVFIFVNMVAIGQQTVTTLMTAFIAAIRCLCVVKPFEVKAMFKPRKCVLIFVIFTIFSIGVVTPILAEMGLESKHDPQRNMTRLVLWMSENRENVKDIVLLILQFVLSGISEAINITCVIVMILQLRSTAVIRTRQDEAGKRNDRESMKMSRKERAAVLQVVIIAILFVICNSIKMASSTVSLLESSYDLGQPYHYLYLTITGVRNLMDAINSSANFWIYLKFNSRFRSKCCACLHQQRRQ